MWTVLTFQTPQLLELYLRTQQTTNPAANANPVSAAKVQQIYFDAASGQHVLVLMP